MIEYTQAQQPKDPPPEAAGSTADHSYSRPYGTTIGPSVASISREPQILALHPSMPTNTVSEFIAYAKANPGKISMASGGNGTPAHIGGELFKMMTGLNLVHVPYRGQAPALADLIGGQVQVMFVAMASGIEYVRAGKLRSLAVTTAMRSEALPNLPVLGDF